MFNLLQVFLLLQISAKLFKLVKSESDKLTEKEEIVNIETVRESSYWAYLHKKELFWFLGFLLRILHSSSISDAHGSCQDVPKAAPG